KRAPHQPAARLQGMHMHHAPPERPSGFAVLAGDLDGQQRAQFEAPGQDHTDAAIGDVADLAGPLLSTPGRDRMTERVPIRVMTHPGTPFDVACFLCSSRSDRTQRWHSTLLTHRWHAPPAP